MQQYLSQKIYNNLHYALFRSLLFKPLEWHERYGSLALVNQLKKLSGETEKAMRRTVKTLVFLIRIGILGGYYGVIAKSVEVPLGLIGTSVLIWVIGMSERCVEEKEKKEKLVRMGENSKFYNF